MIKKLSALTFSTAVYLSLAAPSFAQFINPCPRNVEGGNFRRLCNFDINSINNAVSTIVTILLIVAVIIALFFLIYGGIKWITSGGDKAQLEGARNTIIAAIVGLILVFLTYFILNFIMQFFGLGTIGAFSIPTLQ